MEDSDFHTPLVLSQNALFDSSAATTPDGRSRGYVNALFSPARDAGAMPRAAHNAAQHVYQAPTASLADGDLAEAEAECFEKQAAHVLGQLLTRTIQPHDAVCAWQDQCLAQAEHFRVRSQARLHKPVEHLHLRAIAQHLEEEAASWHLLLHLFCYPPFPNSTAGCGAPAPAGCDASVSLKRWTAELVGQQPDLERCARVVAWLESLAAHQLDSETGAAGASPATRFAAGEVVWEDTRLALSTRYQLDRTGTLVTELDPDAPTRQHGRLQEDDAADERRLMMAAWQLVRAGRLDAAAKLCSSCGQPWRIGSLSGTGRHGPVAVGAAAELQEGTADLPELYEDIACEVELGGEMALSKEGGAAMRSQYKWSCLNAAKAAMHALDATGSRSGGGPYEAAVLGALCGSLEHLMPVCSSWKDACWAMNRCWLDLQVDLQIRQEISGSQLGDLALMEGNIGRTELVAVLDAAAAVDGQPGGVLDAVLEMSTPATWPPVSLTDAVPESHEERFQALEQSANAAIQKTSRAPHCRLQQLLILSDPAPSQSGDLEHLLRFMEALALDMLQCSEDEVVAEPPPDADPMAPEQRLLLRFAANAGIALCELGHIPLLQSHCLNSTAAAFRRIIAKYICFILVPDDLVLLVAPYTCYLTRPLREAVYSHFLGKLTQAALLDSTAIQQWPQVVASARGVFATQYQLEQLGRAEEWALQRTRPDEAFQLFLQAALQFRLQPLPPLHRALSSIWLSLAAVAAPPAQEDAESGARQCLEAVVHSCMLLRELAVGGEVERAAAFELVDWGGEEASPVAQVLEAALQRLTAFCQSVEEADDNETQAAAAAVVRSAGAAAGAELQMWHEALSVLEQMERWKEQAAEAVAAGSQAALLPDTRLLLDDTAACLSPGWAQQGDPDVEQLSPQAAWMGAVPEKLAAAAAHYWAAGGPRPGAEVHLMLAQDRKHMQEPAVASASDSWGWFDDGAAGQSAEAAAAALQELLQAGLPPPDACPLQISCRAVPRSSLGEAPVEGAPAPQPGEPACLLLGMAPAADGEDHWSEAAAAVAAQAAASIAAALVKAQMSLPGWGSLCCINLFGAALTRSSLYMPGPWQDVALERTLLSQYLSSPTPLLVAQRVVAALLAKQALQLRRAAIALSGGQDVEAGAHLVELLVHPGVGLHHLLSPQDFRDLLQLERQCILVGMAGASDQLSWREASPGIVTPLPA